MKKLKIRLLVSIMSMLFAYLAIAFVLAEINPFEWSRDARGALVFGSVCLVVIANAGVELLQ